MRQLKDVVCTSCGRGMLGKGSTTFPCPECGSAIARCGGCREQSVEYACTCGFAGP